MGTVKLKTPKIVSLIEAGEYVRNGRWNEPTLFIGLTTGGRYRFFYLVEGVMKVFKAGDDTYHRYIKEDVITKVEYGRYPWTIYKEGETT